MGISQFKAGYAFQHMIKDYFLELDFIVQEEQWETRTDIVLSRPPLQIAVECKYYSEGVITEHVDIFDKRLKHWQKIGRPCLGVMVATSFQTEAKKLCDQKNIVYITKHTIENALARKRLAQSSVPLFVSKKIEGFINSLAGLLKHWIDLIFEDSVKNNVLFLNPLIELGYITNIKAITTETLAYKYTGKGENFFNKCRELYKLLREKEHPYTSTEAISRNLMDILLCFKESEFQSNDSIILLGLGVLERNLDGLSLSKFGQDLLNIVQINEI